MSWRQRREALRTILSGPRCVRPGSVYDAISVRIAEDLEPPYADAAGVQRGVEAVKAQHGEDGERYLRTLVRYAASAWPGIESAVGEG